MHNSQGEIWIFLGGGGDKKMNVILHTISSLDVAGFLPIVNKLYCPATQFMFSFAHIPLSSFQGCLCFNSLFCTYSYY